jgi:hypothetical protein
MHQRVLVDAVALGAAGPFQHGVIEAGTASEAIDDVVERSVHLVVDAAVKAVAVGRQPQ